MNPNLMEQFLGPSKQFFRFNSNDINVLVTPIEKKTCILTKRNVFTAPHEEANSNTRENNSGNNTRIRFTNDSSTNAFSGSKPQLGVNTVISNTNRYITNGANIFSESNRHKLSSSSTSSMLYKKSHSNVDNLNELKNSLKYDQCKLIDKANFKIFSRPSMFIIFYLYL